jgi:hypothetical protein
MFKADLAAIAGNIPQFSHAPAMLDDYSLLQLRRPVGGLEWN